MLEENGPRPQSGECISYITGEADSVQETHAADPPHRAALVDGL